MDAPLEKAKIEIKQYRSILEMMKGNTPDEALEKLAHRWLDPLYEQIEQLETSRRATTISLR